MHVIRICLGEPAEAEKDSLERKVEDVCTFSEGVEYRARKRGRKEGKKLGKELGEKLGEKLGFVKAMRAMNASTDEIIRQLVMQLGVSEHEASELVQG